MIFIDYGDKRPIYEQIVERFENLILSGGLEPNSKMPSVRALAIELAINPNTIQKAYTELERAGYIYSVKGRGNFVREDQSFQNKQLQKLLDAVSSGIKDCKEAGIALDEIVALAENIYKEDKS
ncbi:MAG: GntR family transcriptional regulator [Dorea sp.]|nr:GntR family transcriptional regulator [Dorea sp.]